MPILKNNKHERFAQEWSKGMTAEKAYVSAGYSESRSAASRLSANVNILSRVREIQSKAAQRTMVTIESLTLELEEARALALKEGQARAAVSATLAKAKLYGLGSETHRLTGVSINVQISPDDAKL